MPSCKIAQLRVKLYISAPGLCSVERLRLVGLVGVCVLSIHKVVVVVVVELVWVKAKPLCPRHNYILSS